MRNSARDVSLSLHTLTKERRPLVRCGGRHGNHHPVFRARIEPYEHGCRLVGYIGWGALNLQSMVAAGLPIIGAAVTVSTISTALSRDMLLDWVFVPVFMGITAMFGYLGWTLGIERLLPAFRFGEIEDLDEELRNKLGVGQY